MRVEHWGVVEYSEAWQRQLNIAEQVIQGTSDNTLVLCQHPDVVTIGKVTQDGALLEPEASLVARGVGVVHTDRGGEATVHNPGQLVGYPIFNLQLLKPDLHWFLREIEQAMIDALSELDIEGGRVPGQTGVWIGGNRKICAIGIHCKKWVITHGFALNVNNDLRLFESIIPCGILDKGVTSISQELGIPTDFAVVENIVEKYFVKRFA